MSEAQLPRDASALLRNLVGQEIRTLTGRPNRVLRVEGDLVIVGTNRSPHGKPVPIEEIQFALNELISKGEIEINVASVGYRSAFIGAVLSTLPGVRSQTNPRKLIAELG